VDEIMDLITTIRYLGVPVYGKNYMFGDNQSVVTNSTIPHSSLNKRHNTLAYHRVREMTAAKVLSYYRIDGKDNPADVVSKHWGYQQVWQLLKSLLFYSGNTVTLIEEPPDSLKFTMQSTTLQRSLLFRFQLSDFRDSSGIDLIASFIIIYIFERPHSDNNSSMYS
jgi:hypothetical protein